MSVAVREINSGRANVVNKSEGLRIIINEGDKKGRLLQKWMVRKKYYHAEDVSKICKLFRAFVFSSFFTSCYL